jgi:hypothetical protein
MKIVPIAALCIASLILAGCDSPVGDTVQSALSPREAPRTRVYQADGKATYEAAKAAAAELGYHYVKGGPAQGELVEMSEVSTGDEASGSSRQLSLKVTLTPADPSGTSVEVSFEEILESTSSNGAAPSLATETPLKDTPLYEVFFRNLGKALAAPSQG